MRLSTMRLLAALALLTAITLAIDPPAVQWVSSFQSYDTAGNCAQVTPGSGYIAAGEVDKYPGQIRATDRDMFVWRTDSLGNVVWRRSYGGSGVDVAFSVKRTSDGGCVLAGFGDDAADTLRALVVRTDSLGNVTWQHAGPSNSLASDIVEAGDGGFVYTWESMWLANEGTYLTKLSAQGQSVWTHRVGDCYKVFWPNRQSPLQRTSDGGYVTAAQQLVKTDSGGIVQWSRTYAEMPEIHSIRQTTDGGFVATGSGPDPSDARRTDVLVLLKTDSQGVKAWVRRFVWDYESWGLCVRQTSDGGYVVAGQSEGTILVRTDGLGNVIWTLRPVQFGVATWCEQTPDGGYVFVSAKHLVKLAPEAR